MRFSKGSIFLDLNPNVYVTGGSMSDANVPRLLVVADRHRCSKLKANALSYLTHNPVQVSQKFGIMSALVVVVVVVLIVVMIVVVIIVVVVVIIVVVVIVQTKVKYKKLTPQKL